MTQRTVSTRIEKDLVSRESAMYQWLRLLAIGIPIVLILVCVYLSINSFFSLTTGVALISIFSGLLTVSTIATFTGFLQLFRLNEAAFVIVADPPLSESYPLAERSILFGRQPDGVQPHPGMLIYPGGLFNERREDDLRETAINKVKSMTDYDIRLACQYLVRYDRSLPFLGIAYVGTIFEGFLIREKEPIPEKATWIKVKDIEISEDIPSIVKKFILVECKKRSYENHKK